MSRQFERFLLLASLCAGMATVMAGILYTVPAAAQPADPRMTEIGSNVVTHTTWTQAGSPYILTGVIQVEPGITLTIEPGVVVMGQSFAVLDIRGSLQAVGTVTEPITFTSELDSGPDEWGGLSFGGGSGDGSGNLHHVIIRYGAIGVSISHLSGNGQIVIEDSAIKDNLSFPLMVDIDALGRLMMSNVLIEGNGTDRVWINSDEEFPTLPEDATLTPQPGLEGYQFNPGGSLHYFKVATGVTLTVEPGVTMFMPGSGIVWVEGHLEAVGTVTQPITFTSILNSAPGQWYYVLVLGSVHLRHATIQYADLGLGIVSPLGDKGVLIEDSTIRDNSEMPILINPDSLGKLTMSNVLIEDNGVNRIGIYDEGEQTIIEDATLSPQPGLEGYQYGINNVSHMLKVAPDVTLTIEPGVTLFMQENSSLLVEGFLNAVGTITQPITVTSALDTGPGEWAGLAIGDTTAQGSAHLRHTTIRYSDFGLGVNNHNGDGQVLIEDSVIRDNAIFPMDVTLAALDQLTMSNVLFEDNALNRVIIRPYPSFTLLENATLSPQPGLEGYEYDPGSEVPIFKIAEVVTLTLKPGSTLYMPEGGVLRVEGHLDAVGTVTQPITFTSSLDSGPGEWGLLSFGSDTGRGTGHLRHVTLRNNQVGIGMYNYEEDGQVLVENSVIRNSAYYPIELLLSTVNCLTLSNVLFEDNSINRGLVYADSFGTSHLTTENVILTHQSSLDGYEFDTGTEWDATIPEGITLTVEPGVTLFMEQNSPFVVEGFLNAVGTITQPITFTSALDSGPGEWGGLAFGTALEPGDGHLRYVTIRYGHAGLSTYTLNNAGQVLVENSQIIDNEFGGLSVSGKTILACTTVANHVYDGIQVDLWEGSALTMIGSSIYNNDGIGLRNFDTDPVDARYNYWGDPSGPGGIGPGSGDEISGTVLYDPWLTQIGAAPGSLWVSQEASPDPVLLGNPLTFTITVGNRGPLALSGVVLTDVLPLSTTLSAATPGQGNCSKTDDLLNCRLGSIAAGDSLTVTVVVTPTAAGPIANRILANANQSEPYCPDNVAASMVQVVTPQPPAASAAQQGDDLVLSWDHEPPTEAYEIHKSSTPYFTPTIDTLSATVSAPATTYTDIGALSSEGGMFYIVRAVGGSASADSEPIGVFGFSLTPGD